MVLTRAGRASRELEASSIQRLPEKMLLHILSFVEKPEDTTAFSLAGKSMVAVASALGEWLWKHHDPDTCLSWAAYKRRGDVILYLLKKGASATARVREVPVGSATYRQMEKVWYDRDASYPLIRMAAMYNLPQVVDYLWNTEPFLLEVRADVEGAVQALISAAGHGHTECLQLLLASPSSNLNANSTLPAWKVAEKSFTSSLTYSVPERLVSALHVAVDEDRVEAVQILLIHGASCTFQSMYGRNALHLVCMPYRPAVKPAARARIVRAILDVPESVIDRPDWEGLTPLHLASQARLKGVCEVLLQTGSQAVNVRSNDGRTPYCMAGNNREVHEVLLRYGADPNL